jgi:hypothetical protein
VVHFNIALSMFMTINFVKIEATSQTGVAMYFQRLGSIFYATFIYNMLNNTPFPFFIRGKIWIR